MLLYDGELTKVSVLRPKFTFFSLFHFLFQKGKLRKGREKKEVEKFKQ